MKFCSFKDKSGKESWGALAPNGKIADLSSLAPNLLEFLRSTKGSKKAEAENLLSQAKISVESVDLQACLPNPPSMRDGYAFRQHVESARRNRGLDMIPEFDLFPVFYYMNHQAVFGPGPIVVEPKTQVQLDFELEAAIVIGKKGKNIPANRADEFIFGYTILNDLSARKVQMDEMKLSMGPVKGKDFANVLGPYLVSVDELEAFKIPGPHGNRFKLEMTTDVNGIPISKGNLADMTWTFAQIIERASYGTWLYPGDVIGSGTVGTGCFYETNPAGITNQWLKPGDKTLLKIQGLGELENTMVAGDEKFVVDESCGA